MIGKQGLKLTVLVLLVLIIAGCARTVTFSHSMRERIHLLDDDLKKVQFYVSEKIVIKREFVNWSSEINREHDLRQEGNHFLETVIINTDTPGIVVEANEDELHVSFEPDPNFYLVFCQGCSGKQKDSDLYTLYSYKVKGREIEPVEDSRLFDKVSPDAKFYFTEYGNQDFLIANNAQGAYLKLKDKVAKNMRKTKRVLPGNMIIDD
jgi:hypothetical protein